MFEAVLDGSHTINGFRNKNLRASLSGHVKTEAEAKNLSSKITRVIRKLRAHKLIAKIPRSTRYKVTQKGYRILGVSLKLKKKDFPMLLKNVA